jgi:hypothetical protein
MDKGNTQTAVVVVCILLSTVLSSYFQKSVDTPEELAKISTTLVFIQRDVNALDARLKDFVTKSEANSLDERIKINTNNIEKMMLSND